MAGEIRTTASPDDKLVSPRSAAAHVFQASFLCCFQIERGTSLADR